MIVAAMLVMMRLLIVHMGVYLLILTMEVVDA